MSDVALGADGIEYYLHDADSEAPHQMYTCTRCGWRMNFTICENKSNHFRHHPGANLFGIKCEDLSKHKDAWEKSEQNEALRVFCKESAVNKELWLNIQELFRGQYTQQQNKIEELEQELVHIQKENMKLQEEVNQSALRFLDDSDEIARQQEIIQDLEDKVASQAHNIYTAVRINMHG